MVVHQCVFDNELSSGNSLCKSFHNQDVGKHVFWDIASEPFLLDHYYIYNNYIIYVP